MARSLFSGTIFVVLVLLEFLELSLCQDGNSTETQTVRRKPNVFEIFLPPFVMLSVCGMGIFLFNMATHLCCVHTFKVRHKVSDLDFETYHLETFSQMKISTQKLTFTDIAKTVSEPFFTSYDSEVIKSLNTYSNKPSELLKICIPALMTIVLGPFSVLFYHSTTEFFWSLEDYPTLPNNNQCVACFLTPAGLVYAISFGFAFSSALQKQGDILQKISSEISFIDQTATLASKLKLSSKKTRMDIYKAIKAEAMYLILQVQHKKMDSYRMKPTEDIKTAVWQVVHLLRNLNNEKHHYVDQLMSRHMIDYISTLNSICSDDLNMLHSRTHWLMWSFLITLGFFSLYGVLMIQAFSYRMELMMTTLTMFSISMLCYIVADLDSPFSGFFRIDIGIIADVLYRLEVMYKMASLGFEETVCYPDSSRFADRRRGKMTNNSEKV